MELIPMSIYAILFCISIIPPLIGRKPFTFYISQSKYPLAITNTNSFLQINNIISYVWAFIFLLSFILVQIQYSPYSATNALISNAVSFIPQILFGVPASILLPKILMGNDRFKIKFNSMKDAFDAMPFGLNKHLAKNVDVIVQFILTGNETLETYLIIKDQECNIFDGVHSNPTLTIKSDSKIWLDITNSDIDATVAFLNKKYEIIGDGSIMLNFDKLFDQSATIERIKNRPQDYNYKSLNANTIKNIVVFDGGSRNKKLSKTTLMVDKFIEGAKSAGANVKEFKLIEKNINKCDGCYMCWTKTPGVCVHKDDMTQMLEDYSNADLIIFASPLFYFNVTGTMKMFIDRLLPLAQPYMELVDDGNVTHPDRYKQSRKQGMIIFSASGFPDIDINFDGLKGMFRAYAHQAQRLNLMAEFYLTSAETIVQPVYKYRRDIVERSCYLAGIQAVKKGKIDYKYMADISNPRIGNKEFVKLANSFWDTLVGKKSYQKEVIKI